MIRMTVRTGLWTGRRCVITLLVAVSAMWTHAASAQERESIPGVSLGLVYENEPQPALAIQPFTGRFGGAGLASQVQDIIGRDLRNSDRLSPRMPGMFPCKGIGNTKGELLQTSWNSSWMSGLSTARPP